METRIKKIETQNKNEIEFLQFNSDKDIPNIYQLIVNFKINEKVLKKYANKFTVEMWLLISFYQKLSIKFIKNKKHIGKLFLYVVLHSKNSDNTFKIDFITNKKIMRHYNYYCINYKIPIKNNIISENFITKFFKKKDLLIIARCVHFSEKLIDSFYHLCDKSTKDFIYKRQILSEKFINKHISELDSNNFCDIAYYQNVSCDFLDKHSKHFNFFDWECIPNNHINLTEDFCEKYFDKLNQECMFLRQNLSESFIEKYLGKNSKFINEGRKKFIINTKLSRNNRILQKIKDKYKKLY